MPEDSLQAWVAKNAWTVLLMSLGFVITWIVIIVAVALGG